MKLRLCSLALAFFALAPLTAFADIPAPPRPQPTGTTQTPRGVLPPARMSIESRKDAAEARLQISQSVLRQLRAEFERDAASDASASTSRTQTIIAGVFLSLSLAFAGVFVVRSRSRATKQIAAGALVVVAFAGALAFKAFANIRPMDRRPADAGSLTRATTPEEELNGVVRMEIVPDGHVIKLIVPAAQATTGRE